jgi:hypothetical protein
MIILFDHRTAWPVRVSYARSLGRSRSAAQLNVGNAPANQTASEWYKGLGNAPLKPTICSVG